MPVYAADVLPDTTGRNLGSAPQRWNGYFQNLDILGSVYFAPVPGANVGQSGVAYVATAPVIAQLNTTAGQVIGNFLVPAGLLNNAGKVLRVSMGGTYTTQAGQAPTLTIAVSFGNLQVFNVTMGGLQAASSNNVWRAQFQFTVYTPGTAGQLDPHGTLTYTTTSGVQASQAFLDLHGGAGTVGPVDLTAPETLQSVCVFSTNTSPSNICVQREFIVEVLN